MRLRGLWYEEHNKLEGVIRYKEMIWVKGNEKKRKRGKSSMECEMKLW